MTRLSIEKRILEKMAEIVAIYHEYNPSGDYLSLSFVNGHISVDNSNNGIKRIDAWLDGTKLKYDPHPLRSNYTYHSLNRKEREFFAEKLVGGFDG